MRSNLEDMVIRSACLRDIEGVLDVVELTRPQLLPSEFLVGTLRQEGASMMVVTTADDTVLAWTRMIATQDCTVILDLGVYPSCHRLGIGSALLVACWQTVNQATPLRALVHGHPMHEHAEQFFHANGWYMLRRTSSLVVYEQHPMETT